MITPPTFNTTQSGQPTPGTPAESGSLPTSVHSFNAWAKTVALALILLVLSLGTAVLTRSLWKSGDQKLGAASGQSYSAEGIRGLAQALLPSGKPEVSHQQRELAAVRLASIAGSKLVAEHYDGGQRIETFVDSWWYQPDQKQFTADVTIKWSGALLAANKYWVKGTLKLPESGSSYRFIKSENSETLDDYQAFKFGVEIADALASGSTSKSSSSEDTFRGIGVVFDAKKAGEMLTVQSIVAGAPASRSVLRAGDQIAKINGQDTAGMDLQKCVSLIRGSVEDTVTLEIFRAFAPNQTLTLTKEIISVTK